jgi:hypothetical protein
MSEVRERLQDIEQSLETLNDTSIVSKDGARGAAAFDAAEAVMVQKDLRKKFQAMPTHEVYQAIDVQASRETGKQASSDILNQLANANPTISKLLDSSGGTALIRQDLEPMLYSLFVKKFPLFERLRKEPANGLVHAYNQITSYGDAVFQTETGTATDDSSTYARQTTNIAVLATRRGITLKSQFAINQGGAGYDGLATELGSGVTAIAHKLQKQVFQGNATTSSGAGAATELGAYDANGFDGLRKILGEAADNAGSRINKGSASYTAAINTTVANLLNEGGNPSAVVLSPTDYAAYVNELTSLIRYPGGDVGQAGLGFGSVATANGALPVLAVAGDSIGSYNVGNVGNDLRDIYVIDEDAWSMPYLGTDSITTLEIPVGVGGALTRLYIMFTMFGLASKATKFNGKIRVG